MTNSTSRFTVEVHLDPSDVRVALEHDIRMGLGARPKELPPKWFYDDRGSQLFEDITGLPEYYPTRCEREILEREATTIAAETQAQTLIELGSGTSIKTLLLLDALDAQGSLRRFIPFDVSESTLRTAGASLVERYPALRVHAIVGDFERHLAALPAEGRRLIVFLGGTIGNLFPEQRAKFFSELAGSLRKGDALLLGTDLVKDPRRLVAAYDDTAGVTAAFNRNVLAVLNRELDGDFVPERFQHVAVWNFDDEWIEMRLRSVGDQHANLRTLGLNITFSDGEELRTEISAKFHRARIESELAEAGLELQHWWTDAAGDFALSLARPTSPASTR